MKRLGLPFRSLLTLALLITGLLPAGLLLGVNEILIAPRLARELAARSSEQARTTAESLGYALDLALASLKELALDVDSPSLLTHLNAILDNKAKTLPTIETIMVLDPRGIVRLAGADGRDSLGLDLADLPLFREPKATGRVHYGEVFVSPFTGKASAFISVPTQSGYVVTAALELKRLSRATGAAGSAAASARLLDGAGTVIASKDEIEASTQINLRPLVSAAPTTAFQGYSAVLGGQRLHCFLYPVADTPWKVLVSYPEAYLGEVPAFVRAALVGGLLAGLIISVILATALAGLVTGPVSALLAATRQSEGQAPQGGRTLLVRELDELDRDFAAMKARIAQREADLKGALAQKEVLLREVHHRVKNNLQIVASLLSLQQNRASSPEAETVLVESSERIRALALVHEKLYRSLDFSSIDLGEYVAEISGNLLGAYDPAGASRIQAHMASLQADIEVAIPIGLIVNEVISNAIKYGSRAGEPAAVRVGLEASEGGFTLTIGDSGPGFDLEQARAKGSLGMILVESLSGQLGAKLTIDASGPTTYTLEVPGK